MTPRRVSFVQAAAARDVLLDAVADLTPLARVAADAPEDAWRSGGPGHWTLDASHAEGRMVRLIVHAEGLLEMHDAHGVRFLATVDGTPDRPPSALPAAMLADIAAIARAGMDAPAGLADWFAVAAALHRPATGTDAGPRLAVDLPGVLSPSGIRTLARNPLLGLSGTPRRTVDAATARLDAACPIGCLVHVSEKAGRHVVAAHPPAAFCDAHVGDPIVAGLDPVGLLRAFARVRAAGGIA